MTVCYKHLLVMHLAKLLLLYVISIRIEVIWVLANVTVGGRVNLTNFLQHRQKRHLIYPQAGNIKLVIGPTFPLVLHDPTDWRSLICLYNLHIGNFPLPYSAISTSSFLSKSLKYMKPNLPIIKPDKSREFLYIALEYFLDRQMGKSLGRSCLLRLICQNAQVHHHIGLFAEILNTMLTPGKENLNPDYKEAYNLGRKGVNCVKRFNICAKRVTFLDDIINDQL